MGTAARSGKDSGRAPQIVIKDPMNVLAMQLLALLARGVGVVFLLIGALVASIPWLTSHPLEPTDYYWVIAGAVLFLMFAIMALKVGSAFGQVVKAKNAGTIVDLHARWIEFSGWMQPENASDYLSLRYWTQTARRQRIGLDDILSITARTNPHKGASGDWVMTPELEITSPSGAAVIRFGSTARRDQLFQVLRAELRMGTPVFEA